MSKKQWKEETVRDVPFKEDRVCEWRQDINGDYITSCGGESQLSYPFILPKFCLWCDKLVKSIPHNENDLVNP